MTMDEKKPTSLSFDLFLKLLAASHKEGFCEYEVRNGRIQTRGGKLFPLGELSPLEAVALLTLDWEPLISAKLFRQITLACQPPRGVITIVRSMREAILEAAGISSTGDGEGAQCMATFGSSII